MYIYIVTKNSARPSRGGSWKERLLYDITYVETYRKICGMHISFKAALSLSTTIWPIAHLQYLEVGSAWMCIPASKLVIATLHPSGMSILKYTPVVYGYKSI